MHLSKQKLDLDDAARSLQVQINKLTEDRKILLAAIDAIDNDKEDILNSNSILAGEAKRIMRQLSFDIK